MSTPYSLRRGSTAGPPAIRVSLFASAMVFFFLIASTVGSSPAQPTMPSTAQSRGQSEGLQYRAYVRCSRTVEDARRKLNEPFQRGAVVKPRHHRVLLPTEDIVSMCPPKARECDLYGATIPPSQAVHRHEPRQNKVTTNPYVPSIRNTRTRQ